MSIGKFMKSNVQEIPSKGSSLIIYEAIKMHFKNHKIQYFEIIKLLPTI